MLTVDRCDGDVTSVPDGCLINAVDVLMQASIRMPSQWYRVDVVPPDLLLTLVGNCGGG